MDGARPYRRGRDRRGDVLSVAGGWGVAVGVVLIAGDVSAYDGRLAHGTADRRAAHRSTCRARQVGTRHRQSGRRGPGGRPDRKPRRRNRRAVPPRPLSDRRAAPGHAEFLGRIALSADRRLLGHRSWRADTPAGPVTVWSEPTASRSRRSSRRSRCSSRSVVRSWSRWSRSARYRLVGAALQPVERIRSRVASMTGGKLAERVPVPSGRRRGRAARGDDERHAGSARRRPGRPAAVRQRRVARTAEPARHRSPRPWISLIAVPN